MYNFPIGVLLESFRQDIPTALSSAKALGLQGIQLYVVDGEMDARTLTPQKKREFLDMVKSNGLVISALCGDFISGDSGYSFSDPEQSPATIERSLRILELAGELETNIVTTHIGSVPSDSSSRKYEQMSKTCETLATRAGEMGAYFAIETGPETSIVLKGFLDGLGSKYLGVNLDPANLVMVAGDDPVESVYNLRDYIVHTHAKDGRKLLDCNAEKLYAGIEQEISDAQYFEELPLGEGGVNFPAYLAALEDIGYRGFLTIERETGGSPAADIERAAAFLRGIINA